MNKRVISRILSLLLVLCMAACVSCGKETGQDASCDRQRTGREVIEELTMCYGKYGDKADKSIELLLKELNAMDPVAGAKWTSIVALWKSVNSDLKLNYDVLPDGLAKDDSLCIVALGFRLNDDGTMRDELTERLKVVKNCAEKYPNALVICTGGPTATRNSSATEAEKMAEWLTKNGIAGERVAVENQSLTTAQNAMFTYDILEEQYPRVKWLAIVSSDYHIATGELLFGAEATLRASRAGQERVRVVSNAAYKAPSGSLSTTFQAIALLDLSDNS